MSVNDAPEIRALFPWAAIEPVQTTYTVAAAPSGTRARELLISR